MPTRVKRLLRILDAKRPQALAGVDRESVTFGDLAEIATTQELQESLREEDPDPTPVATPPSEGADTALQEARTLRSEILLDRKLQESKLPELVQKKIRKVFVGRVVSEEQIQEAIGRLVQGRTTFAIAHRLSTLRNASRLIVLENGEIKEIGTHEELMEKKGAFHDLVQTQTAVNEIVGIGA